MRKLCKKYARALVLIRIVSKGKINKISEVVAASRFYNVVFWEGEWRQSREYREHTFEKRVFYFIYFEREVLETKQCAHKCKMLISNSILLCYKLEVFCKDFKSTKIKIIIYER